MAALTFRIMLEMHVWWHPFEHLQALYLLPLTAFRLLPCRYFYVVLNTGTFLPRSKSFQTIYDQNKIMQCPRAVLSIPRIDTGFDGKLLHLWELFFAFLIPFMTTLWIFRPFLMEAFSLYWNYISGFVPSFQKFFLDFNK